ncbi:MAG: HEAT repeat domain-containing protein [Fimbriimonadaceae bacterium]|nr:HEAT repeat domain-containing protein [Fimbriimonadaceae bacterium]
MSSVPRNRWPMGKRGLWIAGAMFGLGAAILVFAWWLNIYNNADARAARLHGWDVKPYQQAMGLARRAGKSQSLNDSDLELAIALLHDQNPVVRQIAAGAIGRAGENAKDSDATKALVAAVNDENDYVRLAAILALKRLEWPDAPRYFDQLKKNASADVRSSIWEMEAMDKKEQSK